MNKVILVLMDGCRYDTATNYGGFLEHMVNVGLGGKYKIIGSLPSLSKVQYATIFTGLDSHIHGISTNMQNDMVTQENLFFLCKNHNKTSAVAAYWWFSQLYNQPEFDAQFHRYALNNEEGQITHGIFYQDNDYPDSHVVADGEFLRSTYDPDFLLIHPMNIDLIGHMSGGESKEYNQRVGFSLEVVARMVQHWTKLGYQVLVTADHGVDGSGIHGGTTVGQTEVPLYVFGKAFRSGDFSDEKRDHLVLAPTICTLLGIEPRKNMQKMTLHLNRKEHL